MKEVYYVSQSSLKWMLTLTNSFPTEDSPYTVAVLTKMDAHSDFEAKAKGYIEQESQSSLKWMLTLTYMVE